MLTDRDRPSLIPIYKYLYFTGESPLLEPGSRKPSTGFTSVNLSPPYN